MLLQLMKKTSDGIYLRSFRCCPLPFLNIPHPTDDEKMKASCVIEALSNQRRENGLSVTLSTVTRLTDLGRAQHSVGAIVNVLH